MRFVIGRADRRKADAETPHVSIIIPAYNESAVIAEKIENTLAFNYPKDKLEIFIASDGSDDGTNEIVRKYEDRGVKLAAYDERRGKPSVLNETVEMSSGEIIVFSDATTMIEPDALRKMVRHFSDWRVGAVNGELRFISKNKGYVGESIYWRYEVMLKFMENRLGVVLGSSGALSAIRKSAYKPIPNDCICDDLVITLNAILKGFRAVYAPEAQSTEETAENVQRESRRRERISAGDFQALEYTWRILNPLRGWVSLCYISHKIFKWITWFFMAGALVTNLILATTGIYPVILVFQAVFYGVAFARSRGIRIPFSGIPYYFVAMHVAMFKGFVKYSKNSQQVAWQREHR